MAQAQLERENADLPDLSGQLDAFFDVDEVEGHRPDQVVNTSMTQQGSRGQELAVQDDDYESDDDQKQLDISRQPGFYKTGDASVVKINKFIRSRLFFHPKKSSFFVYWKKKNNQELTDCSDDSHFFIGCSYSDNLADLVDSVCDELDATPWDDIPQSHMVPAGFVVDKDNPDYWSETIAKWTDDKSIAVRSYKTAGGFMVRLLLKRRFKDKFPKWIGRTMSMNPEDARRFSGTLRNYKGMVGQLDKIRMDLAKAKQKQRAKEQQKYPSFENVTPPQSPE